MSGFKVGDKVRCIGTGKVDWEINSYASWAGCKVGNIYTVSRVSFNNIQLIEDKNQFHLSPKNFELVIEKEQEEMSYINGDVVEAVNTGEVFLYVGSKWYNLSSGKSEMRGRNHIKSAYGPLVKLTNIANSGDLFKQARKELIEKDSVPF